MHATGKSHMVKSRLQLLHFCKPLCSPSSAQNLIFLLTNTISAMSAVISIILSSLTSIKDGLHQVVVIFTFITLSDPTQIICIDSKW